MHTQPTRAKFIVFEGGEGSGKTYHRDTTAKWLRDQGKSAVTTHEPGGTILGEHIRDLLISHHTTQLSPKTELLLFLADRSQHVTELIEPKLADGEIVLCDRFTGSTLAYQIGARGLGPEETIRQLEAFSRNDLQPDVVIYLDVDPDRGIQRKQNQPGHVMTKFDEADLKFHTAVRSYFQQLASTEPNWITVDANRNMHEVQADIEKKLADIV